MFVQRLDLADTLRLREELLQSLWWKPVGRTGSSVGKVTRKHWGRYQGVKRKQGDQLFKGYSAIPARASGM